MNDIERRTLLGAAGIGALAALSKAGPLDPPAGAVIPTGRTLDEVYNRIPTSSALGAYDGRIPLPASAASITQPGSYILTGRIERSAGAALNISADNVTLDLNGYSIRNLDPAGTCLQANGSGIVIRNGMLSGGARGLYLVGSRIVAEDIVIGDPSIAGITCNSPDGANIRRCTVKRVGFGRTVGSVATGILVTNSECCSVEDCCVTMYVLVSTTPALTIGIAANGSGHLVTRCCVTHSWLVNGQAFAFNGSGTFRENTAINYMNQYAVTGTWLNVPGNV